MKSKDPTPNKPDGVASPEESPTSSRRQDTDGPNYKVTRREFVTAIGALTGGVALRLPNIDARDSTHVAAGNFPETAGNHVVSIKLRINGTSQDFSIDPRVTLLDLLRETAGQTGTKKGCDHGQCGACTVLANNIRINSCLALAVVHDGDEITTIEGISQGEQLHSLQQAFLEHDGFQCGYCTPGQICSAVALLREAQNGDASAVTQDLTIAGPAHLTEAEIRERMSGNICRCGAYPGILQAVHMEYTKAERKGQTSG